MGIAHTDKTPLSKGEIRRLLIAAVGTPLAYLLYQFMLRSVQGYTQLVTLPQLTPTLFLGFLVLGVTGALALLTWNLGFRIAPIAAFGAVLSVPWLYFGPPINLGYSTLPFGTLSLVIGVEGTIRFRERTPEIVTDKTGWIAVGAGLLHFALGFGLQVATRQLFWLDNSFPSVLLMGFIYVVSGIALVVAGALPVILWRRYRLVTPAVATVSWFTWGLYGIWVRWNALPLSEFTGIGWGNFTPHPDYLLKWTGLMIVLLAGVGAELVLREISRFVRN
ncbi:hypothetical protein ACFR9U_17975 [Halorientalis brevis]|uniref:Uncharacterized protein n=1 Tax=Halorientalis brevis TaxID=1126241 RepID=A0ABD6CG83_9EURY|nr:hypothetical protein [Halorientalis brevis]